MKLICSLALSVATAPLLAQAGASPVSSPALGALNRGDFDEALRLAPGDSTESRYVRARVALSRADLDEAQRQLEKLAESTRERAEVAWYLAHARRSSAQIGGAAEILCRLGEPTGRACVDAELYAAQVPAPSVELRGETATIPVASSVPIPLTLVNAGPLKTGFIFDSGASESVISTTLARKLSLRVTTRSFPVAVAGGGGIASANMAILPSLSVGAVTVRNLRVLVIPLEELERNTISGILSPQQAFDGLTVSFDFSGHKILMRKGTSTHPAQASAVTVPYVHAGFDLAIPARVGDGPVALFGVDTGMAGTCTIAADYLPGLKGGRPIELKGAGATALAQLLPGLPVVVGGITLRRDGQCSRTPMTKFGVRLAGLLGNELWKGGTLTLDTVARTVSLILPRSAQN